MTKNSINEKSNKILYRARSLMEVYAQATDAYTDMLDQNYLTIPEISAGLAATRNECNFCSGHKEKSGEKTNNVCENPCRETHLNALKDACQSGGLNIYECPLGFAFWTSPIFRFEQFSGALLGGGFLEEGTGETIAQMNLTSENPLSETELKKLLNCFPQGEPEKIRAMAELMLICTEYLSAGSGDYHAVMKRRSGQQSAILHNIENLKKQYPPGSTRPGYPLEKERRLLEALSRGDTESGRKILFDILAIVLFVKPDQFRYIQYRAIELAVLISRIDTTAGYFTGTLLEANNGHIKSIQEAKNITELTDTLCRIIDDLSGQISSFSGIDHASAIRKAEHFILENFHRKIRLEEIAAASGFSAPYFSTIFKNEMGENLSCYLNRLRVEKACHLLSETNLSLSKMASACGFEDQSWFSKIFKLYTGITPGKFRNQGGNPELKFQKIKFSDDYSSMINK